MGNRFRGILSALLIFALFYSCIEEQNFDQFEDLNITPVIEGSILYVEAPESLINLTVSSVFYTQDFNFDGFSDAIFADRVLDGVVTYIVENTTSKDLDITVEFLDDSDNVLDTERFPILAAPPASIELREISYGGAGRSLDIIRNTSAIRVSAINNGDGTSTSNLPGPKITIKSSGKFRLSIK